MPPALVPIVYLVPAPLPARIPALDPENAAEISVLTARNALIAGVNVPVQKRASQYKDKRLQIIESNAYGHTWSWKANALADLKDVEKEAKRLANKAKEQWAARKANKEAKRTATKLKVAQRKRKAKQGAAVKRSPHIKKRDRTPSPSPPPATARV